MIQKITITNNTIYINGEDVRPPKKFKHGFNVTQSNGRLYVNGFEWRNGKWERTIPAIWNNLF